MVSNGFKIYFDFTQYIITSLDSQYKNDDDVIE